MKKTILSLLLILGCIAEASAQANKTAVLNWSDVTRDVYVDSEIDRAAQVMLCDSPRRIALISPKLDRVAVLDVKEHSVSTVPKEAFRFAPDHASATSDASATAEPAGKYAAVDSYVSVFTLNGKAIFIGRHTGATGEMTEQKIWQTVPVWQSLMESYQPAPDAVSTLKSCEGDAKVTVALGTWCPDSKNYVPKLIKALRAAGNNHIQVSFIGVDNQFHEPMDLIQRHRLINVPTVIVERGGREVGRIVETPAGDSFEGDLAAILAGKPLTHNGRWERGARIARGAYSYRDAKGKEQGVEQWEIFNTREGGRLVHSLITAGGATTEVWHRVDANRRPTFVEVTKRSADDTVRTRYYLDNQKLTARMRGNVLGAIEQTLSVPADLSLSSPSVAAEGWAQANQEQEQKRVACYIAARELDATMGTIGYAVYEAKKDEAVRVPAGEFRAQRFTRRGEKASSDWWLHPQLGVPVRGQVAGGMEYVLTSLETGAGEN